MLSLTRKTPLFCALAGLLACAPDLDAELSKDDMSTPEVDADAGGPNVSHEQQGDGSLLTEVDATAEDQWIYLDLESGDQVEVQRAEESSDWDLGFQRFSIKINGGVSGSGEMEAAIVEDTTLAAVREAPASGYLTDVADGDDGNEDPDYVLREWFDYNPMTHVLTAREMVYVVRTVEGGYYKLQIMGYYSDAGDSGFMNFHWAPVAAPGS